ncbi:aminoacyl-tRNA hydrolase [Halalkalibacillus halophilus]|uniref:aminoacyl-tRNA hydrolase n=1 Tax=Halalkalibacillus halophilus TaxID=392827 RepID=UPI0003F865F4|nr:aminoacyl-tRNA hydrolase [Halalkalibacillus halophilus]
MKCIVGLGNPGLKYKKTRHNIGFHVIDQIVEQNNWKYKKDKFSAHYVIEQVNGEKMIFVKPQTYMNKSGESIRQIADFYELSPEEILVVYDDLDLPPGKIRLRQKGGHGGHNGIRNTIDHLGTKEFNRLRFGIGRPEGDLSVVHYVLGKFSKEELKDVRPSIEDAAKACEDWSDQTFLEVMNTYNQ